VTARRRARCPTEARLDRSFRTLAAPRRAEIRERRSRFIASASPASDEGEARAAVESAKAEHPDATHHCWAWRLLAPSGKRERSHDAGEPAGTAGPPILQAIRGSGLFNLVVVVSRYFGGVKLGKGGLARAYRAAARAALEGAPVAEAVPLVEMQLQGPMGRDGEMRHLVARHGGRVTAASYDAPETAILRIVVPAGAVEALGRDLLALTRGAARLTARG
jgi:uncharacterized YigZ family protein